MTFGIPKSRIPFDESGKLDMCKIHGYIEEIRELEAEFSGAKARTIIPTVNDVLLGRGKPFQSYQGKYRCMFHCGVLGFSFTAYYRKSNTCV